MHFTNFNIRAGRKSWSISNKWGMGTIGLWFCLCMGAYGQIMDAYGAHAVPRPDIGHEYIHALNETFNPANGSVNISINIPLPPGRGLTLPFSLSYNSGSVMTYNDEGEGQVELDPDNGIDGRSHQGWEYSIPLLTSSYNTAEYNETNVWPYPPIDTTCYWTTNYMFTAPTGARHPLYLGGAVSYPGGAANGLCPYSYTQQNGGDYKTVAHLCWSPTEACTTTQVATADGTVYNFLGGGSPYTFASSVQDRNHNIINISSHYPTTTYTDELGRPALTLTAIMNAGVEDYSHEQDNTSQDTIKVPQDSAPYSVQWSIRRVYGPTGDRAIYIGGDNSSQDLCSQLPPSFTGAWPTTMVDVVSKIILPNGTFYKFDYDPAFGLIRQITYPNGAYVQYDWTMQPYFDQGLFSIWLPSYFLIDGIAYDPTQDPPPLPYYVSCMAAYDWPAVTGRRVSFDGTNLAQSQVISYSASPTIYKSYQRTSTVTTTDEIAGTTSTTVYTYDMTVSPSNDPLNFVPSYGQLLYYGPNGGTWLSQIYSTQPLLPFNNPLENNIVYKDGTGTTATTVKTVKKTWGNYSSDIELSEKVTLGSNGPSTTTTYLPNWPDQITQTVVSNDDSSQQQVTNVAYHPFCPQAVAANGFGQCIATGQAIFDRPDTVTVTASTAPSAPVIAETDYTGYDSYGLSGTNGNVGTITKKCFQAGGACADEVQNLKYDSNGQVASVTDGGGYTTQYDYTDNFTSGGSPPSPTNAYPTTITYPSTSGLAHVEHFTYDFPSGHLNGAQDENSNWTKYTYDSIDRLTETDYPDGGKTRINYNDSVPSVTVAKLNGPTTVSVMDSMGHLVQTQQAASDWSTPTVYVDTIYNGMGQVASVSNPHFLTPSASDGITAFSYDGIGRKTHQYNPDGSSISWQYSSSTNPAADETTETDEVGNSISRWTDAFGRLIQVSEPGGLVTTYGYDPLNNLTSVKQLGNGTTDTPRRRSFTYDSLSRLLTSTNPETGTICYGIWSGSNCVSGYDGNGNLLAKIDARGITTSYTYDPLNRLTAKSYSGADSSIAITAASCYEYDATGGSTVPNAVGRLVNEWTQPTSCPTYATPIPVPSSALNWKSITSYDTMGRVQNEFQCPLAPCRAPNPVAYTYDLAGKITSSTNGVPSSASPGILATYGYDTASRLSKLYTSWDDATHPATLFEADQATQTLTGLTPYGPLGLLNAQLGISSQAPQQTSMLLSRAYDNRERLTNIQLLGNGVSGGPVGGSPVSVSISPSPVSFGVSPSVTSLCGDVCGSGGIELFVDGIGVGGSNYFPGSAISLQIGGALAVGNHSVYVVYSGDANHPAQTSPTLAFTVIPNILPATALSVQVSPSPVPVGESGEVDFTLTCNSSCTSPPSGDGYFLVDGGWGGGLTFDENGTASNQTSTSLSVGTHTLTAFYYGNGQYAESSYSGSFTVTQQSLPSLNITLTVAPSSVPENEYAAVSITSSCTSNCGSGHLFVDGSYAGGFDLDGNGTDVEGLFPIYTGMGPFMTPGQHTITADYMGNGSYASSNSTSATFTVIPNNLPAPTVSASVTPYPISSGQPSAVAINIGCAPSCALPGPNLGGGHVMVDGNYAGTYWPDSNGNAVLYLPPVFAAGSHTLIVQYFGNLSYTYANSAPVAFTLTQ